MSSVAEFSGCGPAAIHAGRRWSPMSSWETVDSGFNRATEPSSPWQVLTASDLCRRLSAADVKESSRRLDDGGSRPVTVRAIWRHFSHKPDRPTRDPPLVVTETMLLPSNQLCVCPPSSRNLATGDLTIHTSVINALPYDNGRLKTHWMVRLLMSSRHNYSQQLIICAAKFDLPWLTILIVFSVLNGYLWCSTNTGKIIWHSTS